MNGMVIQSRINPTSVSVVCESSEIAGGGLCTRNSRKARRDRKPNRPARIRPMAIIAKIRARCLARVISVLPLQFEGSDLNGVAFLNARFTQCCIDAKCFQDLLKAAQRTIMFPVGHL